MHKFMVTVKECIRVVKKVIMRNLSFRRQYDNKNIIGDRATDIKQGDKIYEMIIEQFSDNKEVIIDFDGMITVLSTFLNNAIGTLYKDYTSDYLNINLKIVNLCKDDMFILKRVISRAKDFYTKEKMITQILDEQLAE